MYLIWDSIFQMIKHFVDNLLCHFECYIASDEGLIKSKNKFK